MAKLNSNQSWIGNQICFQIGHALANQKIDAVLQYACMEIYWEIICSHFQVIQKIYNKTLTLTVLKYIRKGSLQKWT